MDKQNLSTSNSKKILKFILSSLIFIVILASLLFIFMFFKVPCYDHGYNASLIDKVSRLQSIDEPKIVLIGNSNLAFGINSEEIEEAFNMPVVNMGLHGGLGNEFHERMATINIDKGDIYIICHTGFSDGSVLQNPEMLWLTLENHKDLWNLLLTKSEKKEILKSLPNYIQICIRSILPLYGEPLPTSVYARSAFNEYGDIEWDDKGETWDFSHTTITVPEIETGCTDRINKLNDYIKEREATLLIGGYPIADYNINEKDYQKLKCELEKYLDPPIISNYEDYIYPTDYFFNTELHLNNKGKSIRTRQLIKDLEFFKKNEKK